MKTIISILATLSLTSSVWAQTPPAGTISRSPTGESTYNNQLGTTNSTFTSSGGSTYSAEQLTEQLQQTRATVERTLPVLTGFLEAVSNSTTSATSPGVVGTLSQILANALNRNTNSTSNASGNQGGLAGVLHGWLGTNAPAPGSINATTLRDLATLQTDLRNVEMTLQRLNVSTNSNFPLTPTGR